MGIQKNGCFRIKTTRLHDNLVTQLWANMLDMKHRLPNCNVKHSSCNGNNKKYFYCKFLTSIFIFKIKIIYGVELSFAPFNWPPSSPPTRTWGRVDSQAIEQFVYFDIVATVLGKFEVDLPRQSWLRGKLPLFNQLVVATVWGSWGLGS